MKEKQKRLFDSIFNLNSEDKPEIISAVITDGQNAEDPIELDIPEQIPVLPLRGSIFFPALLMPIAVGRKASIKMVRNAYKQKAIIGLVSQRNDAEEPSQKDMFPVGVFCRVVEIITMPDDTLMVVFQGLDRFKLKSFSYQDSYEDAAGNQVDASWVGTYEVYPDGCRKLPKEVNIMADLLRDSFMNLLKTMPNTPPNLALAPKNIKSPYYLLNYVASQLNIPLLDKQKLLEINTFVKRMDKVLSHIESQIHEERIKQQIQQKVTADIDKQQREYFLQQQLKTIREELGDSPTDQAIKELEQRAKKKKGWSDQVKDIFYKEMSKLQTMHHTSPEYSIQISYLDFILSLPWGLCSEQTISIENARQVLDNDHYGLEKVKERIIEHLSVMKIAKDKSSSPILCLVGPPGVGKTSLGKSIAQATGREYVRIALGGVNDESEIRGHRRTYIGAMPGRILKSLSKAKYGDCVFVLDEIDKLGAMSVHGDPSSAMLEVLDPEQNTAFHDNYLDIDYDLSNIMFIATANSLSNVHPALIDRMEVINLAGYIEEEKLEIAKQYLVPKAIRKNGLKDSQLKFNDKVILHLIQNYTRESGVRQLEKVISKLIRHRAVEVAEGSKGSKTLKTSDIQPVLGLPTAYHDLILDKDTIGVVTGLAWTEVGGEILFVEASSCKGKGNINLTGNLGNVMKESATLAYEYIKSNASCLGIDEDIFENIDINIHCPEGATPKDGPSAGITMFTAMLSVLTNKPVKHQYAMTGEITLRGQVLPVGGIKEKILAAKRANVKNIVLSSKNKRDIEQINQIYLEGLTFHYVDTISQLPQIMLVDNK